MLALAILTKVTGTKEDKTLCDKRVWQKCDKRGRTQFVTFGQKGTYPICHFRRPFVWPVKGPKARFFACARDSYILPMPR